MAIDRGPWNALVDDDGSNLVGSVWNKAAIKTVVLDPTDAAITTAANPAWKTIIVFTGGTFHDWNPGTGIVGNTVIVIRAGISVTGFKPAVAPFEGQQIRVVIEGAGMLGMTYTHESTASTNGYRLHLQAPTQVFTGYWAFITFQYVTHDVGPGWVCFGGASGHQVL